MFHVKLSVFEQRLVAKVLQDGPRLLETIRQYPQLEVYWQDLLERYREMLELEEQVSAAEEEVAAADTRRGHLARILHESCDRVVVSACGPVGLVVECHRA